MILSEDDEGHPAQLQTVFAKQRIPAVPKKPQSAGATSHTDVAAAGAGSSAFRRLSWHFASKQMV